MHFKQPYSPSCPLTPPNPDHTQPNLSHQLTHCCCPPICQLMQGVKAVAEVQMSESGGVQACLGAVGAQRVCVQAVTLEPYLEPAGTHALCHGFPPPLRRVWVLMGRVCMEFFHLQKACVHRYHTPCHFYSPPLFLTITIALSLFFKVLAVE